MLRGRSRAQGKRRPPSLSSDALLPPLGYVSAGLAPAGAPTTVGQTAAAYRIARAAPTGESMHAARWRDASARVADQRLLLAAEQHQDGTEHREHQAGG